MSDGEFMKHYIWKVLLLLMICVSIAACSAVEDPNQTEHSQPVETPPDTSAKTPSRTEDTVLDVTELALSDLEDSHVVIVSSDQGNYVYRFFFTYGPRIEYYEVSDITSDFLTGGTVAVTKALRNSFNEYDLRIFENRFYALNENGITEQLDAVTDQWEPGNSVWVLRTEDMQCVLTEDAQDLWALAQLLFADRGTGIQHFGPTQS